MRESFRRNKWWWIIPGVLVIAALGGCGTTPAGRSASGTQPQSPTDTPAPAQTEATVAPTQPQPVAPPKDLALGKGSSYADAFYNTVKPRIDENLYDNNGQELLGRAIDADHKYPEWKMSDVITDHNFETDERTFAYTFADKSRITFHTVPAGYNKGLKLASVEIKR